MVGCRFVVGRWFCNTSKYIRSFKEIRVKEIQAKRE